MTAMADDRFGEILQCVAALLSEQPGADPSASGSSTNYSRKSRISGVLTAQTVLRSGTSTRSGRRGAISGSLSRP